MKFLHWLTIRILHNHTLLSFPDSSEPADATAASGDVDVLIVVVVNRWSIVVIVVLSASAPAITLLLLWYRDDDRFVLRLLLALLFLRIDGIGDWDWNYFLRLHGNHWHLLLAFATLSG